MHIPQIRIRFYQMLLVALAWGAAMYVLWQPERQVALHMQHLLERASNRNWNAVEQMIDDRYGDAWGITKEQAVREMRQVFQHYFALTIYPQQQPVVGVSNGTGTAQCVVRVKGTGSAVAEYVTHEINSLREPFVFHWQRTSSLPWRWRLVRVEHASFDPTRRFGFE